MISSHHCHLPHICYIDQYALQTCIFLGLKYSLCSFSMQSLHPLPCYSSIIGSHHQYFNLLRNIESLALTFQSITEFLTVRYNNANISPRRYGFFYTSIPYNRQVILSFFTPNGPQTPSDMHVTSGIVQTKTLVLVQMGLPTQNGPSDGTSGILSHP